MIWHAIHSAVGLVVTLIQTRSLRSIRTITKPYSSSGLTQTRTPVYDDNERRKVLRFLK